MANTFTEIASITVGSGGASSINFTSIPGTYTDLLIEGSFRTTASGGAGSTTLTFNGSGTGYSTLGLQGSGSATNSYSFSAVYAGVGNVGGTGTTSNVFNNVKIYIPNYASSASKYFSTDSVYENNATEAYADITAATWNNTSAITQVTITVNAGGANFDQYSTAYIYGIKNS